ncbi:MAG TPA: putative baseplate assembly protein [Steroidobacteraceae bacterium]|jgi:hypothetical protein|nr:putative baseplate assembly protein [Steroidobacteraceae bacterium]
MSEQRERAVLAALESRLPGYTPELVAPREQSAAQALLQAYARLTAMLDEKLERVPERGLLAGLDMLGMHLLPAQAARTPLVFTLQADAPLDVTLPQGSQVAAKPMPFLPALDGAEAKAAEPVLFSTERSVTLARTALACLYSVEPGSDRFADHSARLTQGFALFDGMRLTPHHLYLGHDTLFKLGGRISLILSFVLADSARTPMTLQWEYLTDGGWIPLPFNPEDDTTGGLMASGQVTLRHECGPNAAKGRFGGRESYWLRARLATPLLREGIAPLVTINDLRVRAAFGKQGLLPDAAFADGQSLDVSKDFYPFGLVPALSSSFYVACKDAFERPGAAVKLDFALAAAGTRQASNSVAFDLVWEYTTAGDWAPLSVQPTEIPFQFDRSQAVLFKCPADWAERDVNGVKQKWLRARVAGGDYGKPLHVTVVTDNVPQFAGGNVSPPVVKTLRIDFEYQTDPEPLDHCVVYNDFEYQDVSEAAHWPDRNFVPFVPVADTATGVHFGFTQAFARGLMSLFFDVPEESAGASAASPYVWEYRAADGWRDLTVHDETRGFRQRGMIQFIGPQDAVPVMGLGDRPLHWLRVRLKQGEAASGAACNGVWTNAVWAAQRRRTEREISGRSDGNPGQSLQLQRAPVLAEEIVEVEEWVGRGEGWRNALPEVAESEIRFERDSATSAAVAAWVRWREQPNFYGSTAAHRHYVLERATGVVRFDARVPDAGRRIAITYSSGGGIAGNVAAGAARELRVAVPYLTGASNVIAARGGAERESDQRVLRRGPQWLRHRGRGIAAQDLEWLALEASTEVARAHCLPLLGPDGRAQRGWVSLLVVPHSLAAQPQLTGELARTVQEYLAARMPAGSRLRVLAPRYAPVSVRAVVVPVDAALAAATEARVRRELDRFLHPLQGGRNGGDPGVNDGGWQFGEPVYLSQIAAAIEAVEGVEHAEDIVLSLAGAMAGMTLAIPRDQLVSSGVHELVLRMGTP